MVGTSNRSRIQDLSFTSADYGFFATLGFTVPLRGVFTRAVKGDTMVTPPWDIGNILEIMMGYWDNDGIMMG